MVVAMQRRWNPADLKDVANSAEDFILTTTGIGGQIPDIAGYELLKDNAAVSPEILDAVRHHHEYLDGSGYPDALCGGSIADLVRILTISDIFAALIEDRRYKPSMPRAQAYEILCGMKGKLERPLVTAFREVALNC